MYFPKRQMHCYLTSCYCYTIWQILLKAFVSIRSQTYVSLNSQIWATRNFDLFDTARWKSGFTCFQVFKEKLLIKSVFSQAGFHLETLPNLRVFQDLETMSQELVRLSKYPIQQSIHQENAQSHPSQDTPATTTDKCSTANGSVSWYS